MFTIDFSQLKNQGLCDFLYSSVKEQILQGKLSANEKLPSKRTLANHLGVSIITVQNAYAQLICEGYIYSIEKKGFFVTDILFGVNQVEDVGKEFVLENETSKTTEWFADFKSNSTGYEKFPFSTWAHIMRKVVNAADEKLLQRLDVKGVFALRKSIADYLFQFRNMKVNPNQIVISSGTETLYGMVVQLLGRENIFAVENPGYKKISWILKLNGAKCISVKMDDMGLNPFDLEKTDANIIHISPSHHFPTGIVMPIRRRVELLDWAKKNENRFIIEDDYDSEFRFNGKPLPTLQSSDTNDCVIYINTFSKTLSPSFRISYMILPNKLLNLFSHRFGEFSCSVSSFEQYVLAEFMKQGFYSKHIIRMKNYYKNLRNDLIQCIQKSKIAKIAIIQEEESGLHFLLKISTEYSKEDLKKRLENQKINAMLLSDYYLDDFETNLEFDEKKQHTIVINYSGLKKERITETVTRLENAFFM